LGKFFDKCLGEGSCLLRGSRFGRLSEGGKQMALLTAPQWKGEEKEEER
jgi:hypothetical protein